MSERRKKEAGNPLVQAWFSFVRKRRSTRSLELSLKKTRKNPEKLKKTKKLDSVGRNIIHGSDAVEAAQREIALWFPEGLAEYTPHMAKWIYE